MNLRCLLKRGLLGLSMMLIVFALVGCNKDNDKDFEEALKKEIDRRIENGELAYPSSENIDELADADLEGDSESDLEDSLQGDLEDETEEIETLVGYDVNGNEVKVDGVNVIEKEGYIIYKIGELYPAGEYVAVADGDRGGYFGVSMDPEGEVIVTNGSVNTTEIFDTLDGEYIKFADCKIYPVEKAPKAEKTPEGAYPEATYKVGVQIPAGEYVATGDSASVTILADLIGDSDSTLMHFSNRKCVVVTVREGEYLKVTYGELYPIELTTSLKEASGEYNEGMYKVGFHMPAGNYKLVANVDTAYAEIYDTNTAEAKRIELVEASPESKFTVKEGQSVSIIGGSAILEQ